MSGIDFSQFGFLAVISLNNMVPVTLAAIGEIFGESAGVVDIGLEGIMLTSAWVGVFVSWTIGNPYVALASGLLTGALFGLLHGYISVHLKGDQIISGVGINIFALGFVPFAITAVWGVYGAFQANGGVEPIPTPWGALQFMVPLTFVVAFSFWYLLERTRVGLEVKATGENPEAADAVGIDVEKTRLIATAIGASLAGLAGSYLSIGLVGSITKDISAGRGFIALATVVFAGWRPLLGLVGGLVFGTAQATSIWVATIPELRNVVPHVDDLFNMIPYVATLIVVAGVIGRARPPKSIGVAYKRE